jgi:hypothetical protein
VSLVSQQRVEVILPPSHSVEGVEEQSGFWYGVYDALDNLVYRRVMQNPIRHDVEVFSPESLRRHSVARPSGTFVLLVPDLDGPQSVGLFGTPLEPNALHRRAAQIARFEIRKEQ